MLRPASSSRVLNLGWLVLIILTTACNREPEPKDCKDGTQCLLIGLYHYEGTDRPVNVDRALEYFSAGCDEDNAKACMLQGEARIKQANVDPAPHDAVQAYRKACRLGESQACKTLQRGLPTPREKKQ